MSIKKKTFGKIVLRFSLGFAFSLVLYWSTVGSMYSKTAFVSFQSLLAFLAVILAAMAYLVNNRNPSPGRYVFFIAFLFRAIIHISIGIAYSLISPDLTQSFSAIRSTMDLICNTIFGTLLLASMLLEYWGYAGYLKHRVGGVVIIASVGIYCVSFLLIFPLSVIPSILIAILLTSSTIPFLLGAYIILRIDSENPVYALDHLVAGFLILLFPPIAVYGYYLGFATMWNISVILQALAFAILCFGVGEPLYVESGVSKRATDGVISSILALSAIPFILSILSEAYSPGIKFQEIGAYILSHGAAAILSAMMVVLLIVYFNAKPSWDLLPLIVFYLSWSFIEIFVIIAYNVYLPFIDGESVVPYIIGSIVSLLVIYSGIRYVAKAPDGDPLQFRAKWLSFRFSLVIVALFIAVFSELSVLSSAPDLAGHPVGRILLLVFNLLALFGFSIYLYMTASKHHDWRSIEGLSLVFLVFWIVPGTLKGVFFDWSIGWWFSELLLLLGLGVGPPLLGALYVDSMSRAQDSQRRATLYSDLLAHDITNMHQAILVALSMIEMPDIDEQTRFMAIDDAKASLDRAAAIVENVRQIGFAEQIPREDLVSTDLVGSIMDAIKQIRMEYPGEDIKFNINGQEEHYYVLANRLLMDLFYNLFKNAISYSNNEKIVNIRIHHSKINGEDGWIVRVEDHGKGIPPEKKLHLFKRFMKGAEGIGLGLSVVLALVKLFKGQIEVEDRVNGDYTQGTVFIVNLPESPEF
ncbi:MAG: sensor histidine kinase [Candidatus Thorarchaeota archaeon]